MAYRITKYCKLLYHCALLCSVVASDATAADWAHINVYLKLKPHSEVEQLIKQFNHALKKNHLLSPYHIKPYLEHHPLHITLYLTEYDVATIPLLLQKTARLAQDHKKIVFHTTEFIANEKGYLMLAVNKEPSLQQLSHHTVCTLSPLRNKHAKLPFWAAHDMGRTLIFKHYGSPAVGPYFNPHFSIFSAPQSNKRHDGSLQRLLHKAIVEFNNRHPAKALAQAQALALGIANEEGQIVQELGSFALH